uniref:Uncharacterized protein n=1 Tax=Anguilla anguilla TaxID=7936 RepID=A0A0E9R025_ANGAN
MAPQTSKTN